MTRVLADTGTVLSVLVLLYVAVRLRIEWRRQLRRDGLGWKGPGW